MIVELAYAKVNLALDVVRKREDGYHDLKMMMIPLELHDTLTFELADEISLESSIEIENNAILKAVQLIKTSYNVNEGVKITLDKKIPIGAGLGGGSADIAATLRGLNKLWSLQLSVAILEKEALKLGSDTLFCLHNKPAYVYGRGEHLLFVQTPPLEQIYLFYPEVSVSTKKVFENHHIEFEPKRFNRLFTRYVNEKFHAFFRNSYNVLTETTLKCYPELKEINKKVQKISKLSRMSGSGSTFYIPLFKENEGKLAKKIEKSGLNVLKTRVKQ